MAPSAAKYQRLPKIRYGMALIQRLVTPEKCISWHPVSGSIMPTGGLIMISLHTGIWNFMEHHSRSWLSFLMTGNYGMPGAAERRWNRLTGCAIHMWSVCCSGKVRALKIQCWQSCSMQKCARGKRTWMTDRKRIL